MTTEKKTPKTPKNLQLDQWGRIVLGHLAKAHKVAIEPGTLVRINEKIAQGASIERPTVAEGTTHGSVNAPMLVRIGLSVADTQNAAACDLIAGRKLLAAVMLIATEKMDKPSKRAWQDENGFTLAQKDVNEALKESVAAAASMTAGLEAYLDSVAQKALDKTCENPFGRVASGRKAQNVGRKTISGAICSANCIDSQEGRQVYQTQNKAWANVQRFCQCCGAKVSFEKKAPAKPAAPQSDLSKAREAGRKVNNEERLLACEAALKAQAKQA